MNARRKLSQKKSRRRPHHIEEDAERFFNPFQTVENPDWLVGAN